MKKSTKARLFGVGVLLFNTWLIGRYELKGAPGILSTFGFALAYELFVVRLVAREAGEERRALISLRFLIGVVAAVAFVVGGFYLGSQSSRSDSHVIQTTVARHPSGWTQESTGTTDVGPWLDYSPAGTRFYKDSNGVVYRLYPPGVMPDADPADPPGLSGSTDKTSDL